MKLAVNLESCLEAKRHCLRNYLPPNRESKFLARKLPIRPTVTYAMPYLLDIRHPKGEAFLAYLIPPVNSYFSRKNKTVSHHRALVATRRDGRSGREDLRPEYPTVLPPATQVGYDSCSGRATCRMIAARGSRCGRRRGCAGHRTLAGSRA